MSNDNLSMTKEIADALENLLRRLPDEKRAACAQAVIDIVAPHVSEATRYAAAVVYTARAVKAENVGRLEAAAPLARLAGDVTKRLKAGQ